MGPRLATGLVVSALIRRIEAEGGHAMVLGRGDTTAGAILLLLTDRGSPGVLRERQLSADGYAWQDVGPSDLQERAAYLQRRRRSDPDLWIIELDHPEASRIASEMLG